MMRINNKNLKSLNKCQIIIRKMVIKLTLVMIKIKMINLLNYYTTKEIQIQILKKVLKINKKINLN